MKNVWWDSLDEELILLVHNVLIHPLMGVLNVLGLKRGSALHDVSLPKDRRGDR